MRSSASLLSLEATRLTSCEDEQRKGTRTLTALSKNKAFRPHRSVFHCQVLEHPPGSSLSLAAVSQAWGLEPGPFSVKKGRFFEEALFSFSSKNVITVFL